MKRSRRTRLEIVPNKSVGPINLGMTTADVERVLGVPDEQFVRAPEFCDDVEWVYRDLSAWPSFDNSGICNAIQMFPGCDVVLAGHHLLQVDAATAWAAIRRLDPRAVEDDDSLTSHALGVAIWAPDIDDEPNKPAGSVIVFGPGYYDKSRLIRAP